MARDCVLSVDQGTSATKALVFDRGGQAIARASVELPTLFPQPGWVEQDPEVIWRTTLDAVRAVLERTGWPDPGLRLGAIGLANQGETVLVWEKDSGRPIHNAIVWQCRRTAGACEALKERGLEPLVRARTGLVLDPYFSASKVAWILDHVPGARRLAREGRLAAGTLDTWLIWKMTGGRELVTDPSTASRTMLFDISGLGWDDELLDLFDIPEGLLARLGPTWGYLGETDPEAFLGLRLPITGSAVDQQAALFGHAAFAAGDAKCTYGTGCFLLANTGSRPALSRHGLLTSVGWVAEGAGCAYVLDGGVFVAGAAVQWLRDGLGLIGAPAETDDLAGRAAGTGGVYFVPSFSGLSAPYWDPHARGTMVGLTRGTTREHVVRATLEAIAYQVRDVLEAARDDLPGCGGAALAVDGGPTANRFLMQFQADILGLPVVASEEKEVTARGAAYLAGLGAGLWTGEDEVAGLGRATRRYEPSMAPEERERLYGGWKRAVARAGAWEEGGA